MTTRRKFLLGTLGVLGVGGATAWFNRHRILRWGMLQNVNPTLQVSAAPTLPEDVCVLTSPQVEGPFYFPSPNRKDIVEGRKGKPMNLKMQILNAADCKPIEGAVVELWHCDAEGVYSGYPKEIAHDLWKTFMFIGSNGQKIGDEYHADPISEAKFLRGRQHADASGLVEFNTIFPGWYEGRVPHIHFKVFVGETLRFTSQFYFDQDFQDKIYTSIEPYKQYGKCPIALQNDTALAEAKTTIKGLILKPTWNNDQALEASAKIGVQLV